MLALAGDRRLVEQVRRGSEAAFEVVFERYHRPLLTFCRHMLGSREDSEDALQQTFASAYRALLESEDPLQLKPWLYTIARNRCLSMLRAARPEPVDDLEAATTAGLSEEVERRAELRELVRDLRRLPEGQRAALVLFEIGGLSQVEIGEVLDVHAERVKALVFQARSGLMDWRNARETPCADVREALAAIKTARPRKAALRRHLATCDGCSAFAGRVKEQRALLAIALPAIPSVGLWESVAAAAGIGGGSAGGGLLAGGLSGLAGSGAAKMLATGALVGGLAGGGALVVGGAGEPRAGESDAPAGEVRGVSASGGAGGGGSAARGMGRERSSVPGARGGRGGRGGQGGPGANGPGRAAERRAHVREQRAGAGSPNVPAAGRDPGSGGRRQHGGGGGQNGGGGEGQHGGGGQNAIPPAAALPPSGEEEHGERGNGRPKPKKPKKPKKYKPRPRPPKHDAPRPPEDDDDDDRGEGRHGHGGNGGEGGHGGNEGEHEGGEGENEGGGHGGGGDEDDDDRDDDRDGDD